MASGDMPAPPSRPDWRQHLEVETPEHVALDYELAGIGSRALATILDTLIVVVLGTGTYLVLARLAPLSGALAAVVLVLEFALAWGYFTFFETVWDGQTPGKRWMGIRVVHDTGHGVTAAGAAVRNLLRIADFLPPPYLLGGILVAAHPRAKRLGDLVAGTVVVRDRPAAAPAEPARGPAGGAEPAGAPELDDAQYALLRSFRERAPALPAATRARLAAQVASRMAPAGALREPAAADLERLYLEETARRRGRLGARGPSAAERFVARKEDRWRAFQALAERAARRGLDDFAATELPDFAARYREAAADLARARTYRVDRTTQARLERLVAAGHNALYRREQSTGARLWAFLTRECPAAVSQARRTILLACLVFLAPGAAGYVMLRERPALGGEVLPEEMLERARVGQERIARGIGYYEAPAGARPLVAGGIITNNIQVAFVCFAGGAFAGVGSLLVLGFNGLAIGAVSGHFANVGLLGYLWTFIAGHGLVELFAIWVAGAAGFLIGRALVAPGQLPRGDALVLAGRLGLRLVGAAGVMLVVAGLIEGFVSASGLPLAARVGASAASLLFLAAYLAWGATQARGAP